MEGDTLFAILFIFMLIFGGFNIYVAYMSYSFYKDATYEEKLAPSDYINENQIFIGNKDEGYWTASKYYVLIPLNQEPFVSRFAGTGSMKPLFDENANAIEIIPESENEINAGDIISYEYNETDIIVHRVMSTGHDDQGWFAITKGDNNPTNDGIKIRFSQVKGKMIMVIY